MTEKLHYRAIWISDVHLGARDSKAEFLLDFLRHTDSDYLYLVGDIFDLWKLRSWYWPQIKNEILQQVFEKAKRGTRVVYVPGNHDEMLRDYCGTFYNGVHIEREAFHETADGRRFLVIHGDEFDCVVKHNKWLASLGSEAYDALLRVNHWYNYIRRKLGFRYWSLSAFLKQQVKNAVNYITRFESAVAREAQRRGVDGLICGHIHHASMRRIGDYQYNNAGDWVESCTALVENPDGHLQVLHWTEESVLLLDERWAGGDNPRSDAPGRGAESPAARPEPVCARAAADTDRTLTKTTEGKLCA